MLALLLLGACLACAARAQDATAQDTGTRAEREEQRKEIQAERRAVNQRLLKEQSACYKQFVVDDCLRDARARARVTNDALRKRELELNAADRAEKTSQRQKAIDERQQQHERELANKRPAPAQGAERAKRSSHDEQQRQQDARSRAREQQQHEAEHARQMEQRKAATQPQRIEQERARYQLKQQKARERREKYERESAQRAASGKAPVAPLPPPSAPQSDSALP